MHYLAAFNMGTAEGYKPFLSVCFCLYGSGTSAFQGVVEDPLHTPEVTIVLCFHKHFTYLSYMTYFFPHLLTTRRQEINPGQVACQSQDRKPQSDQVKT